MKLSVFHIFRVSSFFRPKKEVKKPQGTHIIDHHEILYRLVYNLRGKKNFTLFLLCVHLTECEKMYRSKIVLTSLKYENKAIGKTRFSGHF